MDVPLRKGYLDVMLPETVFNQVIEITSDVALNTRFSYPHQ